MVQAEQKLQKMPDIPPPPPAPKVIKADDTDGAVLQEEGPVVTIKTEDDRKIEEYRIRGRLYMIKVTIKNAPPYYLIDRDGDGNFERRRSELDPRVFIPMWVINRW
ncbi:MAG TPA: DUF2782 domain-containing protein [Acidiferrobacteraceae bacterium]|nr:DUF2782 domain-containing protein [Acidiferrobacteraceae bacterium]